MGGRLFPATTARYDGANRLEKTWTDISGQSSTTPLVSYTYDAFGNQGTVTTRSDSGTARVTSYDYDSANRVTKIEYPGEIVGDEEFGYDEAGGLLWKKDGKEKFTLYEYDDLHRLIAVYYLPGALPNPISYEGLTADVTYTYHGGASQRESVTETIGESQHASSYEYDSQGRLWKYTPPLGLAAGPPAEKVVYAYNNAGQKTGVTITDGTTTPYAVSYDYYANGWLKAVNYGGNPIASYSYDAVGNRTRVDYGNGTYTTFGYESGDPRYRLETITHKLGTTTLATFGYTRDDVGNPLSFSWLVGATPYEWEYGYDAMNRLASAQPPEDVPLPAQAGGAYSYDWVGNMKAEAASNPWAYNAADQLTLWPGMHSYEYDPNGALTAVKTADGSVTQQSFTYHTSGLMNTATFNGQTLSNLWDADDHRVQFSIGEDEYTSVFDVTAGIPAVIKEVTPQGTICYVREPGGELICRVVGNDKWFYHFDELGSTRLLTNSTGSVTDRYSYDAYGAVISHDRNTGTIDQPYQYVGQLGYYTDWMAPEFGRLQLGVRFYEPETGRFERRDPSASDLPDYAYAASSPTAIIDFDGRANKPRRGQHKLRADHPSCIAKAAKIHRAAAALNEKITEYIANEGKLPESVPLPNTSWRAGTRAGHRQAICERQAALDDDIEWYEDNCNGPVPTPLLLPIPFPQRPSAPAPQVPKRVIEAAKRAVAVGVGAGCCYYIYRGVRLLPSLAPPLWWTFPANCTCP